MNLNLVNLDCTEWSRSDWQDAYDQYCQHNMFGKKTKREYYDMVVANFAKINPQPLSDELKEKWTRGFWNAALWAKKHGCDMNGRLWSDIAREQRNNDALKTALRAEDVAWDTKRKLDYLIERVRK